MTSAPVPGAPAEPGPPTGPAPLPEPTARLLHRFLASLRSRLPLRALWAHGSLAGGDYRQGRSDLDLIALLDRPCTPEEERHLGELHQTLEATDSLAAKLHCSYLVADGTAADPERNHLTWAHQELMHRTVTPVTRRELHTFGRVLHGDAPAAFLPPVTDAQLAAFVLTDLRDFWRPALDHPERWLQDIWVDLGLLTLARATVTLRDGTLISKGEALAVLNELGAPRDVVTDIRNRRYGPPASTPAPTPALAPTPAPTPPQPLPPARPHPPHWPTHRAALTRAFLGPAIDRTLATYGDTLPTPNPMPTPMPLPTPTPTPTSTHPPKAPD
ncbi:nucleotidyltransferase [Streptomyces inhibens]|uniref:nucleotidyltransferase domain-containing protein n=1 Tax=Streptomyces inhibens TaxID=2293571 RepID=UPI0036C561F2